MARVGVGFVGVIIILALLAAGMSSMAATPAGQQAAKQAASGIDSAMDAAQSAKNAPAAAEAALSIAEGQSHWTLYTAGSDVYDQTAVSAAAVAGTLDLEALKGLKEPPAEVLEQLKNAVHALGRHCTTTSIVNIAFAIKPHMALFSPGSKLNPDPSIAFVWQGAKTMRDIDASLVCPDITAQLAQEFGKPVSPNDVKFVIPVGIRPDGTFFAYTAYAVRNEFWCLFLSDWNYTVLWPIKDALTGGACKAK